MTPLIVAVCLTALPLVLNAAGPSAEVMALHNARTFGALAKECLRVVDDEGKPVVGATIWGGLQTGGSLDDFIPIRGTTDTNGEYVIEGKCTDRMRCDISKDGFYKSEFLVTDYCYKHSLDDGKWQPYGTTNKVILRDIRNLGTLLVPSGSPRSACRWEIPVWGRWIGFDMELFDWVQPFGNGKHDDVLLMFQADVKDPIFDICHTMSVCFTNTPYGGAYVCQKEKLSDFQIDYMADTSKEYKNNFFFVRERKADGTRCFNNLPKDSFLVFRTRTKVDEKGNLVSAHYGAISGEWAFGSETMRMDDVCFNPVENDTSIEDGFFLRKRVTERNCQEW